MASLTNGQLALLVAVYFADGGKVTICTPCKYMGGNYLTRHKYLPNKAIKPATRAGYYYR